MQELFADAAGHSNGFLHLAELDTNADGMITSADDAFSSLQIWRYLDGDGRTDDGEFGTLDSFGITEIDLAAIEVDETNAGHTVTHRSQVSFADGSTTSIDDVHFEANLQI